MLDHSLCNSIIGGLPWAPRCGLSNARETHPDPSNAVPGAPIGVVPGCRPGWAPTCVTLIFQYFYNRKYGARPTGHVRAGLIAMLGKRHDAYAQHMHLTVMVYVVWMSL